MNPLRGLSKTASQATKNAVKCRLSSATPGANKFDLPERYKGSEESVWVDYIQLAQQYKPLNLGQGFPDFAAPDHITKALSEVAAGSDVLLNQYTRGFGHPRLVNAISKLYSGLIGREINPLTEILVGAGAYGALFSAIYGHINPGDEAILIEPFYDCFETMVKTAGGKPVYVPLRLNHETEGNERITSSDWKLDENELRKAFNSKTKMIILNTPHNPLGKVFTRKELELIAELCIKWNVLCISDEVYEWLVYKPNEHIRIATLPGMWERTITFGSAGKMFSVTGWKIGWAYGPASLIRNLQVVHQNCVYTISTPAQEAVARALEHEIEIFDSPECYLKSLAVELKPKRDFLANLLEEIGMRPIIPEAGFFMLADWTPLEAAVRLSEETDQHKDYRFTKWMIKNVGLQGIPPSAFYGRDNKHLGENYVRYCFIKKDDNLRKAEVILKNWKQSFEKTIKCTL